MPLRWIMRQGAKGKSFPLVFRRKDCTEAPGAGLRPAGAQKKTRFRVAGIRTGQAEEGNQLFLTLKFH
jgi:hypothetical protein